MRLALTVLALGSTVALLHACGASGPPVETPVARAAPLAPTLPPAMEPASSPAAGATAAPSPPPADADALFAEGVRPVLERRCTPCHFPGGKMYDRLPFDDPGTVRRLGEKLFTRIREPAEVETFRRFLAAEAVGAGRPPSAGSAQPASPRR